MKKNKEYNEPKQTLQALKNLGAETKFVSFEKIFNEFMNIRGSKAKNLTKKSLNNLYGRVRRSLVLNKNTLELKERIKTIKEGDQSRELSISLKFPEYLVKSKHPITIIENGGEKDGDIKDRYEVEENEFKLIKVKNEKDSFLKFENEIVYEDEVVIGENQELLSEGKIKSVLVNSYERNPKARKICIEHFGVKCQVCDFDFEKKYGKIGKDFIHVHHKIEISTIGNEYSVNPLTDLIPVCPNCHSMLHKKKPTYSIEELKIIMK
jgi:predicted HNH restriction endonuclease